MTLLSRAFVVLMPIVFLVGVSTATAQKRDPYLLTQKEIAEHTNLNNAFEAVQQLRPRFFRGSATWTVEGGGGGHPEAGSDPSGGSSQSDGILVVVDGVRRGGVEELKIVPAAEVESIRFIKSEEARDRYGPQAGVIELKTSLHAQKP